MGWDLGLDGLMAAESTEIGFSMADNNTSRFRSSDPFGHGSGPTAPANDPLAELARLIGQNDPFAEFGARPSEAPPDPQGGYDQYPTQPYNGQPTQAYQQEPVPQFPEELPPLRFGGASQPRQPAHDDWPPPPAPSNAYHQPAETYGLPPPMRSVPGFDTPSLPEPVSHPPADDYYRSAPFDASQRGAADPLPSFLTAPGHPSQPSFAQQPYAQHPGIYPPQADTGAMPAPHDDEFYDDAPRPRRKGLLTVAAVLLLAVVGTAGAVAYRNYFGGPSTSGPPPVIRASADPSKVPPPSGKASSDFTKDNYERFPERSKDERIVGREEKPIDQKDLGRSQPASVATPPSRQGGSPPFAIGPARQVRTVPITPNSGDMAVNTPSTTPDGTMLPAPPQTSRPTGVQFPPPPSRQVAEARPEAPTPPPAARSTPPRTVTASRSQPAPAPVTSGNAPLSLSPDGQDNSPPPQASAYRDTTPPVRQANAAPAPRVTASSGSRFHVQVASQKSESDAESSFRGIQSKYSGVLGGQPHVIRRADLGSKGTYYRAMVGPFGSREQAVQLCSSLKSAGGDCVVQAN
jgi:cell division protein FtsN